MLNAHKQVEFQFKRSGKVYSLIFELALILYAVCGYYTFKLINTEVDYSLESLMFIAISLLAFILGTYALFYSISYIFIHIKNKYIINDIFRSYDKFYNYTSNGSVGTRIFRDESSL